MMTEMGSPARTFGRYLASRADLLPLAACQVLADDDPGSRPLPWDEERLRAHLDAAFGPDLATRFASFELDPLLIDDFGQVHRAHSVDGKELRARVIRPEAEGWAERGSKVLDALDPVLAGNPWFLPMAELQRAFRQEVRERIDSERQASSLRSLRERVEGLHGVWVPRVVDPLCRPGLLITEAPPAPPLDRGLLDLDWPPRLAVAWLQLALTAGRVEISALAEPVAEDAVGFGDGGHAELPMSMRVRLWDYLRAVAAHDPDRALHALWPMLDAIPGHRLPAGLASGDPRIELRTRFRQAIPFRDGGFEQPSESLTEYAMLHWRWLRRLGYRLPPPAESFFRGLFWVSHRGQVARPDQDDRDPVERGLDALQWISGFQQLERMLEPHEMSAMAEEMGSTLLELPQVVDRLLDSGALSRRLGHRGEQGSGTAFDASCQQGGRAERTSFGLAAVLGLGLAAAALAVLDRAHGDSMPWLASLLPWLFAGLGLAFLRTVARL